MENLAGQLPSSPNLYLKVMGLIIGFVVVVAGSLQLMLMSGYRPSGPGVVMVIFPVIAIFIVGVVVYFSRGGSRASASQFARASLAVSCPTCGAANNVVAGQAGAVCAYCSSRLVPSPTIVRQVLDAGAVAERQAGLRVLRAERAVTLGYRNAGVDPMKFIPVYLGGLVVFGLFSSLVGSVFAGELQSVGPLAITLAVVVSIGTLTYIWRRRRHDAWATSLQRIAMEYGGRYSKRLDDQVMWLNSFWAETYSEYYMFGSGLRFGLVSMEVAGYAMLLDTHPEAPPSGKGQASIRRLNILVAAYVPLEAHSLARLPPDAHPYLSAIQEMGFKLSISTSGILAEGSPELIKRCSRNAEELLLLTRALESLAGLAAHLGPPAASLHEG